jgi:hypothetical protein
MSLADWQISLISASVGTAIPLVPVPILPMGNQCLLDSVVSSKLLMLGQG